MTSTARGCLVMSVLLVALLTAVGYTGCSAHPRVMPSSDGPVLANIYLGEYWLAFTDVNVSTADGSQVVLGASAGDAQLPDRIPLRPGVDVRSALNAEGWAVREPPKGPVVLQAGEEYRVKIRANSALVGTYSRTCSLRLGSQAELSCSIFR